MKERKEEWEKERDKIKQRTEKRNRETKTLNQTNRATKKQKVGNWWAKRRKCDSIYVIYPIFFSIRKENANYQLSCFSLLEEKNKNSIFNSFIGGKHSAFINCQGFKRIAIIVGRWLRGLAPPVYGMFTKPESVRNFSISAWINWMLIMISFVRLFSIMVFIDLQYCYV